jgi:hypothetical protein
MPLSPRLRCLFVHIPKTGGTSVERALGMFGDWRVEDRERLFGRIASPDLVAAGFLSRYLQHLTLPQMHSLLPPDRREGLFSFSFVRNPWDRMVSIHAHPDPDMVQQAAAQGLELEGLPFATFLERLAGVRHIHLLSQHDFILDSAGRPLVDFIGRFETLAEDFAKVAARLGVSSDMPHANASTARRHRDYRSCYTPETRDWVACRYSLDIERFGYAF